MTAFQIAPLYDEAVVRTYLRTDQNYAAYALGDLDPPYSQHAQWHSASLNGDVRGLALHYTSLNPEVLFVMGDDAAVRSLLQSRIGPDTVYYTAKPHQETLLREVYALHEVHHMYRMRITGDVFRAIPVHDNVHPVPLCAEHTGAVHDLLRRAAQSDEREVHDIAFAPAMVDDGYYFGVFSDNRLIAVAGTHIVASKSRIAAVGNVVVDPDKRRQGLGKMVTAEVTRALLSHGYQLVVLNVRQDNTPAVSVYRRLGYWITGEFIEGLAVRGQHTGQ